MDSEILKHSKNEKSLLKWSAHYFFLYEVKKKKKRVSKKEKQRVKAAKAGSWHQVERKRKKRRC